MTIDELVERYIADLCDEYPVTATSLGIDGHDHRLGDYSAEAFARRAAKEDEWASAFGALADADLTLEERIDRDLVLAVLRGKQVMREWAEWRRQPALYLGPGLNGVFALFLHRINPEPELAAAAEARLRAVPDVLAAGKQNLDPALAAPLFVERAIAQCRAAVTYCRTLVPAEVSDPALRTRLAEAGEIAARAYEDFGEHLEKLRAEAAGPYAIGEELYSALLREKEMLGYGARDMRERGRAAYDELSAEMSARAKELRGTTDWRAVLEELSRDHPATPEDMRRAYEEWTLRARDFLIAHDLVTMPQGERCLVEPSPVFQRPMLAVASYMSPPAFKPSKTGHFFVPFPPEGTPDEEVKKRLQTNGHHSIPAVSVHEAYPGHHWHLTHAQSNPRPIRRVHGTSYFSEGWALYTEVMMREQGFFTEPAQELCQFDARIFRAARIVVDTSLHIGDMSFEDAVSFMRTKASLSEPTARAEVGRYCTWPTQASSYLTGSLEIEAVRRRYLARADATLKSFHDGLAGAGSLPVALAEQSLLA